MNTWAREEQQLWDTMIAADRPVRTPSTKNLSPKARVKLRDKVQKQRAASFAAGWKALNDLIAHR